MRIYSKKTATMQNRQRGAGTAEERHVGSRQGRVPAARFWVALGLAALSGVVAVLTLVWKDWLEAFGIDPDHHDGAVESLIVVSLLVLSAVFAMAARVEWRRAVLVR